MNLPEEYVGKITSMFGLEGKNWLENINKTVEKYIEKFNLINTRVIDELSYNLVLFAECEQFGEVVLKIGLPDNSILREMIALEKYNGKGACKCHYSNKDDRVMVLERLLPGDTLHNIKNRIDRIKIFCDTALNLIIKSDKYLQLPNYRGILNKAFAKAKREPEKYKPYNS